MKKTMKGLPLLLIFCVLLSFCANAGGEQNEPFMLYPAYMVMPLGQHVTLDADTGPVILGKQTACKNAVCLNRFGMGVDFNVFHYSA